MSKFGWSYPPGVTESMLPGNSREEQEQEAMIEALYEAIKPFRTTTLDAFDDCEDKVVDALEKIVNEAYAKGRADALADEALAAAHSEGSGVD